MKKIFSAFVAYIKETDKLTLLLCVILSSISVVLQMGLLNAGKIYRPTVITQAVASAVGLVMAVILSKIDYHFIGKLWKLHVPLAYFLVLLTFFIGFGRGEVDDVAWFVIPIIKVSVQPAEFLKISFIVAFGVHLQRVHEEMNTLPQLALLCLHGSIPILLTHLQGDDGTALMMALIFICMLFAAGLDWRYVLAGTGAAAIAAPIIWFFFLDADKKKRFLAVFQPGTDIQGAEWQQYLGRISIGSGGVWGNGIFAGEGAFQPIPELHNDFIFSFIGNAMGFMGSTFVLLLLGVLCVKMLYTARRSLDILGSTICVGVFAMIALQILINVGMNIGVVPVIGITLPFFSAGGTSIVATYLGIGLVLSVYMNSHRNLFTD